MKTGLVLPSLSAPRSAGPKNRLQAWFLNQKLDEPSQGRGAEAPWYRVLWLTGVDYFSTLGYQPGIALMAAGALSPVATAILVVVTLLGALPIYYQIARRSYAGQGSIAMLENLLPGWGGKLFVLFLLGFAGTDFVITMTLSAADASKHAIHNPYLHPYLGEAQLGITIGLLALLAIVFLKGFQEAIGLAMAVAIPYLILNLIVIGRSLIEVVRAPELFFSWRAALASHGDWSSIMLVSILVFPKLALGLSGFETGVTVMPLISGGQQPQHEGPPEGRIRASHKLLASAALVMSFMLLASSMTTTLLISEEEYANSGPAAGRALAFLAHRYLGEMFGIIYDLCSIAILWFAGASAMAGLLNLIPRYLPRFGMAPTWVSYARPLVVLLFAIDAVVTLIFRADVETQAGAYATGVLALILSAGIAVALALWREFRADPAHKWQAFQSCYFWLIAGVFAFTLVDNIFERPDGVIIAGFFTLAIVTSSIVSRYRRSTELRVSELVLIDEESERLWPLISGKKVNLVPTRVSSRDARITKAEQIRQYYSIQGPIAFLHVHLIDNRSEFLAQLRVRIRRQREDFVVEVFGAVATANTVAYISELIDPVSLFLGLARRNLMGQALRYLLFGEGEVGLMVYTILIRYWEWTPEEDVRPLLFLMSD